MANRNAVPYINQRGTVPSVEAELKGRGQEVYKPTNDFPVPVPVPYTVSSMVFAL